MTGLSAMKIQLWRTTSTYMELPICGHLSIIVLHPRVELDGHVPSLDGYGDRMDWGELTKPTRVRKLLNASELLLFFDD